MATDFTDPVTILTLVQTIVLALTMVIFILSFRSQNLSIKEAAYQKALDDYTATITMLVENPQLGKVVDEIGRGSTLETPLTPVTVEDRAIFGYMLLNYSLFERIYLLYARKWIDKDTWEQWHTWLKTMAKNPMFREIHNRSQGTFDKKFQELVEAAFKAQ